MTEAAQNSYFFHESEEASENQPVALPGRLNGDARETPAVTQGSPGHQVTSLGFAEFFGARFDYAFFVLSVIVFVVDKSVAPAARPLQYLPCQ